MSSTQQALWPLVKFSRPALPPLRRVIGIYEGAYTSGQLTNGALVARLEATAAERLGVRHVVAVSSCTSGLMLVLRALDLSGEVILPSFTFIATGHSVLWNGLTPVFADCDADTWNIDLTDVEAAITERTCAILGVHVFGNPADAEGLTRIATNHGIKLIFDAAHAFGASHRDTPIGRFGDAEVFSLSPTKRIVAGEGGLVTTNDAALARRLRAGRNYGNDGDYDPKVLGLNARMSDFHAALALAGLDDFDSRLRRQRAVANLYMSELGKVPGIGFPQVHPDDRSTFTSLSMAIDETRFGVTRDRTARGLLERNIETRQYFSVPLHRQRLFQSLDGLPPRVLPNTDRIAGAVLTLPCYEALTDEEVVRICAVVSDVRELG